MRRTARTVAIAATGAAVLGIAPLSASASLSPGQFVFVVKDQAGGAYYNISTGARYALVATSAAPTLGIAGIETTDGLVLTADGQLLQPLADAAQGTPAVQIVAVARTAGVGTWEDVATGAQYTLVDARAGLPLAAEYALQESKDDILTVNDEALVPIQIATGLR